MPLVLQVIDVNTASRNFELLFTVSVFHRKTSVKSTNRTCGVLL